MELQKNAEVELLAAAQTEGGKPLPSEALEERRIDPKDGASLTMKDLIKSRSDFWSDEEIVAYWKLMMPDEDWANRVQAEAPERRFDPADGAYRTLSEVVDRCWGILPDQEILRYWESLAKESSKEVTERLVTVTD